MHFHLDFWMILKYYFKFHINVSNQQHACKQRSAASDEKCILCWLSKWVVLDTFTHEQAQCRLNEDNVCQSPARARLSFSFKDTPIKMSVEKAQQSISPLANGPSGFAGCRSHSFINVGVVWTSPTISSLAFWIQQEDNKKVGGFGVILGLV